MANINRPLLAGMKHGAKSYIKGISLFLIAEKWELNIHGRITNEHLTRWDILTAYYDSAGKKNSHCRRGWTKKSMVPLTGCSSESSGGFLFLIEERRCLVFKMGLHYQSSLPLPYFPDPRPDLAFWFFNCLQSYSSLQVIIVNFLVIPLPLSTFCFND